MEKPRFGIIGVGQMGSIHLDLLKERNDVVVEAVCDIDEERLREAEKKGVKRLYKDYQAMIDEGGFDAVIIATPPKHHVEQAIYAYKKGLYVLLEKPVATSLDDALKLYNVTGDTTKIMVAFSLRYHPFYEKIKKIMDEKLGKPLLLWHIALGRIPPMKWVTDRNISGGMLNENGVHIIYLYYWWAGVPKSVTARMWTLTKGISIEDNIIVEMEHSLARSSFIQSWSGGHRWRKWGVVTEKGRITCEGYLSGNYTISLSQDKIVEESSITIDPLDMYRKQLDHFIDCIVNGIRPVTSIVDGVKVQEIIEAAYKSAKENTSIRLPLL
ncbi:Gfo/Idh/MocA family oxidoreductase [Desulfurococcaceae archaeon MEX13E-LK6-19]|nr:Gfo/Idh/MocA family oxidoreductase [Desulfurococcaceae archaeon MEX13E-LK6-19]